MQLSEILIWWKASRQGFVELLPDIVAQIDNEAARLDRLLKRSEQTVLCFLGQSGIGKSTLINAIVADSKTVLPAGGTGPLTAIATKVRYSERPYMSVTYQNPAKLRGILLNIERLAKEQGATIADNSEDDTPDDDPVEGWLIDARDPVEPQEPSSNSPSDRPAAPSERQEILIRAAQILVKGVGTGPVNLQELASGLRFALGLQVTGKIDDSDRPRLLDVADALKLAQTNSAKVVTADGNSEFAKVLQEHTAGALAPLVSEIEVGWPSPVLEGGVVLVDLPGVGIAGDDYQRATHSYVRQQARGVVMVVRRGVTYDEIELIRTSGFWERALLAVADPEADPCDLVVAVTQVDSTVESKIHDDMTGADIAKVYADVMRESEKNIGEQTIRELGRLSDTMTDDQELQESRRLAASQVLDRLTVHPVSAFDYRRLVSSNPRRPALASSPEETGIPRLSQRLQEIGRSNAQALAQLRNNSAMQLTAIAAAAIDQELASLAEGRREKEELDRLRADLARFLEPIRLEYAVRQGQFREFLDSTSAALIEKLVERAQADARKSVVRYLAELSTAPWATMRAAVVRGGAFHGKRRIDLSDDIALLFQDPVAAIWGSKQGLLRDVRARTMEFGTITRDMIVSVLDWAEERHGRIISTDGLDARRRAADALADQLGRVGQDAVNELRQTVRDRLLETTKPAIEAACRRFVEKGDAAGPGVKKRMIELFADLAEDSMKRAAGVAHKLLTERFAGVRQDISDVFERWGDPLDRTAEAIAPAEYTGDSTLRAELVIRLEQLRPPATYNPDLLSLPA